MSKEKALPSIEELKELEIVTKYDEDISNLISEFNSQVKEAKDSVDLSDIAFFDIGKKLLEVQKKIKQDIKNDEKVEVTH